VTAREQVVQVATRATSFTAVCAECAEQDAAEGYSGSTFAGRLDLDLSHGTFLCRRGHSVRVVRAEAPPAAAVPSAESVPSAEAAA
jgi:hypothetical protein